ncbi:MAG: YceI family protein [Pannonibacter sp.]
MTRIAVSALALALFATPALADPVAYEFDKSHSNLSFAYNHLGYSTTDGRFGGWDAKLVVDADKPEASSIELTIDTTTLDTFFADRDKHLKSADFFDVAKFPKATFKSTKVTKTGDKELEIVGDLTIKDVTKPATLKVTVTTMGEHPMAKLPAIGFAGTTTIKRSDYGMNMYVPYVGDDVTITLHAETLAAAK